MFIFAHFKKYCSDYGTILEFNKRPKHLSEISKAQTLFKITMYELLAKF